MSLMPRVRAAGAAIAGLAALCGFTSNPSPGTGADFIVTAAPVYKPLAELRGGERFPSGAQLLLVRGGKTEPLVAGFAATADADVSYDGKTVLFAGKKTAGDRWQIWEVTLADGSVRKVTSTGGDAERPFHLPGGRLVWAERGADGFQLESSDDGNPMATNFLNPTAGPGILPLTYVRSSVFPTGVLHDGRILFESGYPLGSGSTPEIYVVYADGSGVESYRCDHGHARWDAVQAASGDVVFTHGASLARFTSALAHEEPIAAPLALYAGAIAETESGAWLVSARRANGAHYAISLWDRGPSSRSHDAKLETVLAMNGMDLVDPVVVAAHQRPNRHPSGLHDWNFANLLALDSRVSRDGALHGMPATVRLETQDAIGHAIAVGTAPVEADGSFFVKAPADRPIRFTLFDRDGKVLRQEQGWFWIRKGEQRYCVGCHAGPERGSENRVPEVLMRSTTPADLTGNNATHAVQGGQ